MIDLHSHTNASDGRCSPPELVSRAAAAGVTVLGVTDHDTVAGCEAAAAACGDAGIEFVPGIEITSILEGVDVHMLGYFIDTRSQQLQDHLAVQRQARLDRFHAMIEKLKEHGVHLDAEAILKPARSDASKSVGRPWIARALVAHGHARDTSDAFDKWLSPGRPGFMPRSGPTPAAAIEWIHDAGGVASLAHPGLLRRDEWILPMVNAGLDAIEVYHTKHDAETTKHYMVMAERLGVMMSGGSDYHADDAHGSGGPGSVSLPRAAFEALKVKAGRAGGAGWDKR